MESNIKGLVSAGHEMASELKAECGAVDMRSVAKLISDLATQLEVQLVRANALAEDHQKAIESIKQADAAVKLAHEKFSALAAENAGLKSGILQASENMEAHHDDHGLFSYDADGEQMDALLRLCDAQDSIALLENAKTPATDAFLAEVRAQGVKSLSNAVQSVIAERQRHQSVEGWTPEHDDEHCNGELAMAAVCYINETGTVNRNGGKPWGWPWDASWWKPNARRRNLVKAGALILAEIERIDRAAGIGKGE